GNGDGTFQSIQNYNVTLSTNSMAIGDFNRDGILDIAAYHSNAALTALLGNGDGTFNEGIYSTPDGAAGQAYLLISGDFNGDGKTDVAAARGNYGFINVLGSNGDGTFTSIGGASVGDDPRSLVSGDFNNDEIPDIAVAVFHSNTVVVLLGKGDGTFDTAGVFTVGAFPIYIATGDFNNDGKLDISTANLF